jgi:phosphoribosylformylglycinamidine cyclo-ligase
MIAAVSADVADAAVAQLTAAGVPSWVAGSIKRRDGTEAARLTGNYR